MSQPVAQEKIRKAPTSVPDRLFSSLSQASAATILLLLSGVAFFLTVVGWSGIFGDIEGMSGSDSFVEYVGPLVFGTVYAATLALLIATPLAFAVALFISHYAPRRLAQTLGHVVDLLAAIPSVVFGIWGITVVAPLLSKNVYPWANDNLSFIPFFSGTASTSGRTMLTAGMVLAMMILPIITAISRDALNQVPTSLRQAAYGVGTTRWGAILNIILPAAISGIVGGIMLALGRAMGETMAVTMIIGNSNNFSFSLLAPGNTISSMLANQFGEADGAQVSSLMYAAFILIILTLAVNILAQLMVRRLRLKY